MALLGLAAGAAQAQDPPMPKPPSEQLLAGGRNPAVTHLMQAYGISEEVAQERIQILNEVVELATRLNNESDPAPIRASRRSRLKVRSITAENDFVRTYKATLDRL
jgi:hypothetical protein